MKEFKIIFWDFDGVIKDSMMVKSIGYEKLFLPYGKELARRVREHHEAHGGISRYEKIPIYLSWAGVIVVNDTVQNFCDSFSDIVKQAVIEAPWVPGVREYLLAHYKNQKFVLVTATPQGEIEQIMQDIGIIHCFYEVHGAPGSKVNAIKGALERLQCPPEKAIMVGDSDSDLTAAEANQVSFLLRRTALNQSLQKRYLGPMCNDFNHE